MADPSIRLAARRTSILLSLVVLALGAAACGSAKGASISAASTGAAATGTGSSGSGAGGQDFAAYRACLQEHGVANGGGGFAGRGDRASGAGGDGQVAPAPGVSGAPADAAPRSTVDQATLAAAQTACESLRPAAGTGANGGFGGFGGSGASGAGAQEFNAYLSCLADNGVATSPGPAAASGATGAPGAPGQRGGLGAIDRSAPAFTAANDKCKVLLPDGVDPFAGRGTRGGAPGAVSTTTAAN